MWEQTGNVFPMKCIYVKDLIRLLGSSTLESTLSRLRAQGTRGSDSPPDCHSLPRPSLHFVPLPRGEGNLILLASLATFPKGEGCRKTMK